MLVYTLCTWDKIALLWTLAFVVVAPVKKFNNAYIYIGRERERERVSII
jgi:hypothetical protein